MDDKEVERLAKALFEKDNTDPTVSWDAVARSRHIGSDTIVGIGEGTRDKYRERVRSGA